MSGTLVALIAAALLFAGGVSGALLTHAIDRAELRDVAAQRDTANRAAARLQGQVDTLRADGDDRATRIEAAVAKVGKPSVQRTNTIREIVNHAPPSDECRALLDLAAHARGWLRDAERAAPDRPGSPVPEPEPGAAPPAPAG